MTARTAMRFPALQQYLDRLNHAPQAASLWLDRQGRVQGRYFNATLTSAFQPVRMLDSKRIVGFDGYARSYSESDPGLSLWKLLDHAASDDESVELDRLCRMLHAINFYRQPESAGLDLYLSVHGRLLAAVGANHGIAFRRVLEALGLPHEKIVLQLPPVTRDQRWLLNYVADNHHRNGFRLGINAVGARQALDLLYQAQPEVLKVDAREIGDAAATLRLLRESDRRGVQVVFKRVESATTATTLRQLGEQLGQVVLAQGFLWDQPQASLDVANARRSATALPAGGAFPFRAAS